MRYKDSVAQSAEYLRLALPLMSRQAAALHPVSYAVWYEYVAGANSTLKAAVDEITQSGAVLNDTSVAAIFRKHIAELDDETAQRVTAEFQNVLLDMSQSAAQAGDQAGEFGKVLEQWSEEVGSARSGRAGVDGVEKMLNVTRQMQGAITSLHQQLDDSKKKIEKLSEEVDRAREEALSDGLTGLLNRKGFDRALDVCLSTAHQNGPSLLIADIDHFKRINDSYGHLFGDKVLRSVAKILKANIKGGDTAARFGGEEFIILLPDTPMDGAHSLAEKIRGTIERSRIRRADSNEEVASVTISFGVASYRAGESANDFIARVDSALYASKNLGRNLVTSAGN